MIHVESGYLRTTKETTSISPCSISLKFSRLGWLGVYRTQQWPTGTRSQVQYQSWRTIVVCAVDLIVWFGVAPIGPLFSIVFVRVVLFTIAFTSAVFVRIFLFSTAFIPTDFVTCVDSDRLTGRHGLS